MNTSVKILEGIEPSAVPEAVFAATEPVILKGLVSSWPSVVAGRAGTRELLEYLHSRGRDVLSTVSNFLVPF